VGRLDEGKNHEFVLRLLPKLPADDAHLYVYGAGPKEDHLRRLSASLAIEDKVSFMGWMDSDEIWPQVDLLLVSSLHEGASNALLEALAYGVPILASDIPGHRDMLRRDELLPLDDVSVWQDRINAILARSHPELRRLADKQQAQSEWLRFDWNKAVYECIVH
jgi:glycosyltransferase involved in cell wall biosynthesis